MFKGIQGNINEGNLYIIYIKEIDLGSKLENYYRIIDRFPLIVEWKMIGLTKTGIDFMIFILLFVENVYNTIR